MLAVVPHPGYMRLNHLERNAESIFQEEHYVEPQFHFGIARFRSSDKHQAPKSDSRREATLPTACAAKHAELIFGGLSSILLPSI